MSSSARGSATGGEGQRGEKREKGSVEYEAKTEREREGRGGKRETSCLLHPRGIARETAIRK